MVTFQAKGKEPKEYEVKELFARGEGKLAKEVRRMNNPELDEEAKVDAAVEIVHLFTGIDKGDLNALKLAPLLKLAADCVTEYGKRNEGEAGNAETQA